MKKQLIRMLVKARLRLTSRGRANRQIVRLRDRYLAIAGGLTPEQAGRGTRVPRMLGVDEDMREWSIFQILEHNAIVNRCFTDIVENLANGTPPTGAGVVDPKQDVMPGPEAGPEQVEAFRASVDDHLTRAAQLASLRRTGTWPHPIFGDLNAHGWHSMLGLHLEIHLKQALAVQAAVAGS